MRGDAVEYANWRSKKEGLEPAYGVNKFAAGGYSLKDLPEKLEGYRLLTSYEWEYAARGGAGGKATAFAGSDTLKDVGWYNGNSGGKTHPVGELTPNALGLYDMSGNVCEWVNTLINNFAYCAAAYLHGDNIGVDLLMRILRQAGISRVEWEGTW